MYHHNARELCLLKAMAREEPSGVHVRNDGHILLLPGRDPALPYSARHNDPSMTGQHEKDQRGKKELDRSMLLAASWIGD